MVPRIVAGDANWRSFADILAPLTITAAAMSAMPSVTECVHRDKGDED